jgi:NADH:ubiquinone oxidoreductase subunit C
VYVVTSVARDNPLVPTVMDIWPIAEWQEREVYDLFGVLYDGHPDLRRLFLEDDWVGFPLRKDYEDDFMLEPPT